MVPLTTKHIVRNAGFFESNSLLCPFIPSLQLFRCRSVKSASLCSFENVQICHATCGFAKAVIGKPDITLSSKLYGEDACFAYNTNKTAVFGVADGVGGWSNHGIDPSVFSSALMRECESIVKRKDFLPHKPRGILRKAFATMQDKSQVVGSSTACILSIKNGVLYAANLGDSGFMLIRRGKIVARSPEQVHFFNAPFQLCIPPKGMTGFFGDSPGEAIVSHFDLRRGDLIILATDGYWDNVPDEVTLDLLKSFQDPANIKQMCLLLAQTVHRLSVDRREMSPFALKAIAEGHRLIRGGKIDDVTIILLLVV